MPTGNGKDFFARNCPLNVQPLLQIEGAYLLQQEAIFQVASLHIVGFDARAQRVQVFLPFPGATAVIYGFASDYATH